MSPMRWTRSATILGGAICAFGVLSAAACSHKRDGAGGSGTTGATTATATTGVGGAASGYLAHCKTLFAARIVEKQRESDGGFPEDCDIPLATDVGALKQGVALCKAGESANACLDRIYANPPSLQSDLQQGCADGGAPVGCMRGKWVPRCKDGSDTCQESDEAKCQDGTRPLVYMEGATSGSSSRWLFHMGGEGGPCVGTRCWVNYRYSHLAGDDAYEKAMSSTHPDHPLVAAQTGQGVTAGAVNPQNPFAAFNRVKFERCGDAASTKIETVPFGDGLPQDVADALPPPLPVPVETRTSNAELWHHGFATWVALFHSLTTDAGRDLNGDGTPDVPSLAGATQILLAGSSDASIWVVYAADRLAEELRAISGPNVDVRILIDGYFEPSLDSAGRYAPSAPANFNLFDDPYNETGLCALPDNDDGIANESCSDTDYKPGPAPSGEQTFRDTLDTRGVIRDDSCEAMHGPGAPACSDKLHNLFHHVKTPFLVLADQEDATISGTEVVYADDHSYTWHDSATYRVRILDQAKDVSQRWSTSAREEGAGTVGNAVLILPKSRRGTEPWNKARHVRFGDNAEMLKGMSLCDANKTKLGGASFAQAIGAWATNALAFQFVMEDAASWNGTSNYWITGDVCGDPE